jgi:penicillin amidase
VWRDIAWTVLAVLLAFVLGVCFLVRGSLPQLDGEIGGLNLHASIERDDLGTPTIKGASRSDLAFATGFAHAQDRFFQMDLMRRAAAGELAELLGATVLERDRAFRLHGLKQVAQRALQQWPPSDRELLDRYVAGVNSGLDHLTVRPWEYLLLGSVPRVWTAQDSLMCAYAMYLTLNDPTGQVELSRAQLQQSLPPELFGFLYPIGSEWDAPLSGGSWRSPPIPSAQIVDLRETPSKARANPVQHAYEERELVGSNVWAVDGAHAQNGAAILASDMHLGLRLPHIWYRARLIVGDMTNPRDLVGVTLPGLPILIVGSNRQIAWGFSNSYGDWTDLIVVEVDPANPDRYLVGENSEAFTHRSETIKVRDQPSVQMEVVTTRWGPVVSRDAQGRPLALAWTAHHPRATNMRLLDLEHATSVAQALEIANRSGTPVQNFVVADAVGRIGWTLMGQVPVRTNFDPNVPSSWRAPGTGWTGWQPPQAYPKIVDPPSGRLWLANARPIDAVAWLGFAGAGNYDTGARAGQIRDRLLAMPTATIADMAKLQLDDRALFLVRWRDLLLQVLEDAPATQADRRAAHDLVANWSGRAAANDAGYAIVRAFRLQTRRAVFDALTAQARAELPQGAFEPWPQFEGSLWQLVTQKPPHLLDPSFANWDSALLVWADAAIASLRKNCTVLSQCTWGRENTLQMTHPLSAAVPWVARWLDMPERAMNGDSAMPLVQGPKFGASERLVVSPGREAEGLLQMPGGPVDHPLSKFYGAGHEAWVRGEPQPLLPGKSRHTLRLRP